LLVKVFRRETENPPRPPLRVVDGGLRESLALTMQFPTA